MSSRHFYSGMFFTCMLTWTARRWLFHRREVELELARKDAEIARKDGELARKDIQFTKLEDRLAELAELLGKKEGMIYDLQERNTALAKLTNAQPNSPNAEESGTRVSQLEIENHRLVQTTLELKRRLKDRETELERVTAEMVHWADWCNRLTPEGTSVPEDCCSAET